jgi:ribose transport system substrate-binding protein
MATEYPKVTVLDPQEEGFDAPQAAAKAVAILQAHPDVTAAFSTTGGGALTWSNAERQTGKKVTVISMDYIRQNLDLVKGGSVYGVVAQPLFDEGAAVASLLDKINNHQAVSYLNQLDSPIVTVANVDKYYAILQKAGD